MADDDFEIIGKGRPLSHAKEKVSGNFEYVGDMELDPETLHVKVLRSPHPHAMIENIDTSEAEKLEGVETVITHEDVPEIKMPRSHGRAYYILTDHARFVGDEIAAVAAQEEEIAEEAIDLIDVEYDILEPVYDPEEASKDNAPKIYPEGNVYGPQYEMRIKEGINEPTVLEWGDIEAGFDEADVIVEDNFDIGAQVHAPLEMHVTIADFDDDELKIWTPTQCPYEVRESIADVLSMPESKVRIISKALGGAFGGKYIGRWIAIPAFLAKELEKPVKFEYTREEEQIHRKRPFFKNYVKIGAKEDGKLTAISFKTYIDLGGYGDSRCGSCALWGESPVTAYKFENARIEAWDVHTNYFSSQAFRTPQIAPLTVSMESVVDEVSEELGIDPGKLRLKNMPDTGDVIPPKSYKVNTVGYPRAKLDAYPAKQLLKEVREEIDWDKKWKGGGKESQKQGKLRGVGIGYTIGWSGFCYIGYATETVTINRDGTVHIISGHQDVGTGSDDTLKMLAAESLGIPVENVSMTTGDTHTGQYDLFASRGSSALTRSGHLILQAIEKAKKEIRSLASEVFEAKPGEIEIRNRRAYVRSEPEKTISFQDLLTSSITRSASGDPGHSFETLKRGEIKIRNPMLTAVEVEVDSKTYEIEVKRIVTGNNPGKMINPKIVKGQLKGAAFMAMNYILNEEVKYDEKNRVYLNNNLTDYILLRSTEAPEIENVISEEAIDRPPYEALPYGAKGVGEMGYGATPAAVANAISSAVGVRIKKMPITPERLLKEMSKV